MKSTCIVKPSRKANSPAGGGTGLRGPESRRVWHLIELSEVFGLSSKVSRLLPRCANVIRSVLRRVAWPIWCSAESPSGHAFNLLLGIRRRIGSRVLMIDRCGSCRSNAPTPMGLILGGWRNHEGQRFAVVAVVIVTVPRQLLSVVLVPLMGVHLVARLDAFQIFLVLFLCLSCRIIQRGNRTFDGSTTSTAISSRIANTTILAIAVARFVIGCFAFWNRLQRRIVVGWLRGPWFGFDRRVVEGNRWRFLSHSDRCCGKNSDGH